MGMFTHIKKVASATIEGIVEDNVTKLSASLSYAMLFSAVPILFLLVNIGVLFDVDLEGQVYSLVQPILGNDVVHTFQSIINNAAKSAASASLMTYISIGASVFAATTVFVELQDSLNLIYRIKAVPKRGWLKFIINRLISFAVILSFALVMLITFTLTTLISKLGTLLQEYDPNVAIWVLKGIGLTLNFIISTMVFALLFKYLPDAKIRFKDVLVGASFTTILFLAGQWAISLYLSMAKVGSTFGAAAFIIVFITWIYYSSIIIYVGAEFTKAWTNTYGHKVRPKSYAAIFTKTLHVKRS